MRMIRGVKEKPKLLLLIVLMLVFAITRWPGLMPPNFSAAYGLAFCAGVYFAGGLAWLLPLGAFLVTDVLLNLFYYQTGIFDVSMLVNYAAFAAIILLGRSFKPTASWLSLLAGGLAGALLFYFLTNSASWLLNPLYPKSLLGWIQALTIGTPGWPHTWEFFRNTLLSGGLFAGLFAGAMKLSEALEAPEEQESAEPEEVAPEETKV
jgi:hypothetical protein